MKIFSNFDTWLAASLLKEAQEKYGVENVLFVRRDKVYLFIRLWLPVILRVFISFVLLYFYYGIVGSQSFFSDIVWIIVWTIEIWLTLYLLFFFWHKLLDYYMDYVIITPRQIVVFDQDWILKRETRSLDPSKIKTINISSAWLMGSIFNFGSIVFLAEWDREHGDIKLNYIYRPVMLRERIEELIDRTVREGNEWNNESKDAIAKDGKSFFL